MDNINTMLFAGSDTTSLALAWTLHLLATHPEVQTVLRTELVSLQNSVADPSDPTIFSILDELPQLDNVIRESLRLIPPVHSSLRVAMEDDMIPTSDPVRMRDGTIASDGVYIKKGTFVHVALEGINMLRDVWGDDAPEFRPARWENLPEAVKQNPGIYAGIMTFSHGPRVCFFMSVGCPLIIVFRHALVFDSQVNNAFYTPSHPNLLLLQS
jgi:cytochrome P450